MANARDIIHHNPAPTGGKKTSKAISWPSGSEFAGSDMLVAGRAYSASPIIQGYHERAVCSRVLSPGLTSRDLCPSVMRVREPSYLRQQARLDRRQVPFLF